jgi:hypothetical protein
MPLALDVQQRIVEFTAEGKSYKHIFRRISPKDWDGYFSRLWIEEGADGQTIDLTSALLWLWDECVVGLDGYGDGATKERIRMAHRIGAARVLTAVVRADDPALLDPSCETVALTAAWHDGEKMVEHGGLVHRFAFPSCEQMMRYSRDTSRTLVTKRGTVIPTKHKALVALYDELIQSVEGYEVNGHPLAGRDNIVANMDAFHKFRAIEPLFSVQSGEASIA